MDIYCPRCGEPTDTDELHELVASGDAEDFSAAKRLYFSEGCGVLWGNRCEPPPGAPPLRAMASAALADVLGDDVDGLAATLDDFEFLGMLDD